MFSKIYLFSRTGNDVCHCKCSTRAEALKKAENYFGLDRDDVRDADIKYGKKVVYIKLKY